MVLTSWGREQSLVVGIHGQWTVGGGAHLQVLVNWWLPLLSYNLGLSLESKFYMSLEAISIMLRFL